MAIEQGSGIPGSGRVCYMQLSPLSPGRLLPSGRISDPMAVNSNKNRTDTRSRYKVTNLSVHRMSTVILSFVQNSIIN